MKHLFVILAAAQKAYNAYLASILAQMRSEAVRDAFVSLGREAAQGLVESGLMAEAQRSAELQGSLSVGAKDLGKIAKLGFEGAMGEMNNPTDPPSNEDSPGVIPIGRNLQ